MTLLFGEIIFGPIKSRRLGLSLGVNLLPTSAKLCNFNCIYCECGYTRVPAGGNYEEPAGSNGGLVKQDGRGGFRFNRREDVRQLLEAKLREMVAGGTPPDVITFAGNGEPTMHPEFEAIIDDTTELRDAICPSAKVSVLSNATMIGRQSVRRALLRVDNNILKLDSAFDDTVRLLDDPLGAYSVAEVVRNMKLFEGRLIIQTMFLRRVPAQGNYEEHAGANGGIVKQGGAGLVIDNTTEKEVSAWLELVREIAPRQVMIYTIDRDTPAPDLEKIGLPELQKIAERVEALGISCSVSG